MISNILLWLFQLVPLGYCAYWRGSKTHEWVVFKQSFFYRPVEQWIKEQHKKENADYFQLLTIKEALRRINYKAAKNPFRYKVKLKLVNRQVYMLGSFKN